MTQSVAEQTSQKEFFFTSKAYRLQKSSNSQDSYDIQVPTAILRHQAEVNGMTVKEFAQRFHMVAKYVDDRPGFMIYEFKEV